MPPEFHSPPLKYTSNYFMINIRQQNKAKEIGIKTRWLITAFFFANYKLEVIRQYQNVLIWGRFI